MRSPTLLLCFALALQATEAATEDAVRRAFQAGESALRRGDLTSARRFFNDVLTINPADVGAQVNLGVVDMREKHWDDALRHLRLAEKRAPQVTGIRLNIGLAEYRKADYAAAIPPFESVLRDDPAAAQARQLLGFSYLFAQQYEQAAATLAPLWPTSKDDMAYLYSLAVAAGYTHERDLEDKALAQLLAVGNDSPFVHLLRGKAFLARGDFEHASAELQPAQAGDPNLPLLHYYLGLLYRREGKLDAARSEFTRGTKVEPLIAFNYEQLGALSSSSQRFDAAQAYFRRALELDPKLGAAWFGLAKVYKQQKRNQEGLEAVRRALSIDPTSASAHYLYAQLLKAVGRTVDAASELRAVNQLNTRTRDKLQQQLEGTTFPHALPDETGFANDAHPTAESQ